MIFDGRSDREDFGPWKRRRDVTRYRGLRKIRINSFNEKFDTNVYANMDLPVVVKRAALKTSQSVVSLISSNGQEPFFLASGTIIECEKTGSTFTSSILTSASLVRTDATPPGLLANLQIEVRLFDGQLFEGQVDLCDFHYNILIIKIKSEIALRVAVQRYLDDYVSLNPEEDDVRTTAKTVRCPQSDYFKICPGELVIALGRFKDDCEFMVAPGQYGLDVCGMDCMELLRADCNISKCGIGGPLINRHGEVIGLNFYNFKFTPFLPMNVVSKFLENFKDSGKFCRPLYGMEMTNLYAVSVDKIEKLTVSDNFKGVLIENVTPGSPSDITGLHGGDLIIKCNENSVHSLLEIFDILMDNIGKSMGLVVIRNGTAMSLQFIVDDTGEGNFYSWPLPSSSYRTVEEGRRA